MKKTFEVNTIEELDEVTDFLAQLCEKYHIFTFDAEMGTGKTTLIGKLCQKLQTEENASSPTYAIYNEYYSPQFGSIYHFDCYRLKDTFEALDFGMEEILDSSNICLIEWPEKIRKLLPENFVEINIELIENKRLITLKYDT